jgi:choline dehydrogenase-like flavoprotein
MTDAFDAIIVGSGAGGAAAAYSLAEAGCRVLIIEKGQPLPKDGSTLGVRIVVGEGRFKNHEPWLDGSGSPFVPQEYYNLGGKTKWYGAALLRFGADEFAADAAHQCRGWPFGYDELAPFYEHAEMLLAVRRFDIEPDTAAIVGRLQRVASAWRSLPMPLGLSPAIADDPHESIRFDGFASVRGLKSDAETSLLDRIRDKPNVRIVTGAAVAALCAADGNARRVVGVVTEDGERRDASAVLLAAGALSSPRLIERYLRDFGLADTLPAAKNVGRNYKSHLLTAVIGFSVRQMRDRLRKTVVMTHADFPHSSVQPLGATDGEIVATEMPAITPRWFANLVGSRAYGFFLQTEDGSHPDNRVTDDDDSGKPRLDYRQERIAPARDEHRAFVRTFARHLLRAGFLPVVKPIALEGTAHACGTLIAGSDPFTSVVDATGRVHGMEGIYVVDGSVLPRSSRVNPALTIYAWGLRAGDHLAASLAASQVTQQGELA